MTVLRVKTTPDGIPLSTFGRILGDQLGTTVGMADVDWVQRDDRSISHGDIRIRTTPQALIEAAYLWFPHGHWVVLDDQDHVLYQSEAIA